MTTLIVFSLVTIICALLLTGYRIGIYHADKFYSFNPENELTPIYDALANDFPSTALKLVAPITMEVAER